MTITRYVAFLRAINIGNRRVKMDALRTYFEALGLTRVQTFIASGNVLFDTQSADAPGLERQVGQKLRESLGYPVETFLRTGPELAAVVAHPAFDAETLTQATALNVAFLATPPGEAAAQKLLALRNEIDDFHLYGREVYWICRKRQSESTFSNVVLEKTLGQPATLRGFATVEKLAGLVKQ